MAELIGVAVLFIVLSLLERWARGQARENTPETGERPVPPRPSGAPTKPRRQRAGARKTPGPQGPLPQELPQVERRTAKRESALLPAPQVSPVLPQAPQRRKDRPFHLFAGFRGRNELRRAIVIQTVLGPPLANQPYSPEGTESKPR